MSVCAVRFIYILLSSLSRHTDLYAAQAGETAAGSRTDLESHEQRIRDVQKGINSRICVCLCSGMSGVSTI